MSSTSWTGKLAARTPAAIIPTCPKTTITNQGLPPIDVDPEKGEPYMSHHEEVRITIEHKHLVSPTPTTGAALYQLGGVPEGYKLYRETAGPHEDPFVPHDHQEIHAHDGEKFYFEPDKPESKTVEIIIDRKRLESLRETTGAALYVLGAVAANYTLYRETAGPEEDEPIPNAATPIRVSRDEKFYSSPGQVTPGGLL